MKKFNIMTLLVGAALFTGFGVTSASAEMKCGGGKCGSSTASKCGDSKAMNSHKGMTFEDKKKRCTGKLQAITKCVDKASNTTEIQACRAQIVELANKIEKMHGKMSTKCGNAPAPAKCGGSKKAPAMKCGPGKCGK